MTTINRTPAEQDTIRQQVRAGYAQIAHEGVWNKEQPDAAGGCCGGGGCCGPTTISPDQLAQAIGYEADDLAVTPEGANMGLSCGNPAALASLKPGEVVLDLGSGGGFDVFIAAKKVGSEGRAIGVDMTPDMLSTARRNAAKFAQETGLHNVEFRLGEIEHLPVADQSVDVIISNCVLNLSPDKPQTWREIARVLKPGGRVAVSDLALKKPLPEAVAGMLEAYIGCIAGAALISDIERDAVDAGLREIALTQKDEYITALSRMNDPLLARINAALPEGESIGDYITSLNIEARK